MINNRFLFTDLNFYLNRILKETKTPGVISDLKMHNIPVTGHYMLSGEIPSRLWGAKFGFTFNASPHRKVNLLYIFQEILENAFSLQSSCIHIYTHIYTSTHIHKQTYISINISPPFLDC